MKYLMPLLLIALPLIGFGKTIGSFQPQQQMSPVVVGKNKAGELAYYVYEQDGNLAEVSQSFFSDSLEKAIKTSKHVVCDMKVLPQQVTISSVVVSVTYDTKQFCPEKK